MEFKNRDLMKPHYSTQILPVPSGPSLYQGSTPAGLKYENALYTSPIMRCFKFKDNAETQQVLQVNHEILLS